MDPFKNMSDWKRNMDSFFGDNFWNEFEGILKPQLPQVNLYKKDKEIICIASIPGLRDLNNIEVFVFESTLEIKGDIKISEPGTQLLQEEILQGSFERKIDLPYAVRDDKIEAAYQRGLLVIRLHRLITSENKTNKIAIKDLEDNY
ncbi:Hsp20/alpha crystallin family protein [Sediminibacillus massiliensis]|uniref:Hsp20/alpha crystallin family protein n=1 Tax=Sediminibacillus massiliensis TaxID=1926277 RepID=UPI0009887113|nr:Hsp20/alpha crystallin family protein [Sediminibacillus massiliensis]